MYVYCFTESNAGAIIGGVVGGIVGALLLVVLVVVCFCYQKNKNKGKLCLINYALSRSLNVFILIVISRVRAFCRIKETFRCEGAPVSMEVISSFLRPKISIAHTNSNVSVM